MAKRLTALSGISATILENSDLMHIIDVSNTTHHSSGTSYKLKLGDLKNFITSGITFNCNDLDNCSNYVELESDVSELSAKTENHISCNDLSGCTVITDIWDDIDYISGQTGNSTFTGNTSTNCINEFHVENIYGCEDITVHNSIQHTGSTAGGELSVAFGKDNTIDNISNYSSILGGKDNKIGTFNNSAIIGGESNEVGATNSIILGGNNISATIDNTAYVDKFNIQTVSASTSENVLVIEDDGTVNTKQITGGGGGSTFTGNTLTNCINEFYVENIYGCEDITVHNSIQHTGSTAGGELSVAFGEGNTIDSISNYSSILSGKDNAISDDSVGSTSNFNKNSILGGEGNKISFSGAVGDYMEYNSIIGGKDNEMICLPGEGLNRSAIIGGGWHEVRGTSSVIIGGQRNVVTSENSVVLGGVNITGDTSNTVYVPKLVGTDIPQFESHQLAQDINSGLEVGQFYCIVGEGDINGVVGIYLGPNN